MGWGALHLGWAQVFPLLCAPSLSSAPSVSLILAPQSELGNPLYRVLALTSTTEPVATFAPCLSSLGVFYMVTHLNDCYTLPAWASVRNPSAGDMFHHLSQASPSPPCLCSA